MSTTSLGREAEQIVANNLVKSGHKILAQNWRTKRCEIDIVAQKKHTVYFVEVKYRAKAYWGDGLDVITDKKLAQMTYAAEVWCAAENWSGDCVLMVASVSGRPLVVEALFEL